MTSIAGLVGRLEIDEYGEPDWTAVRSFADWADQYPDAALDSIAADANWFGAETFGSPSAPSGVPARGSTNIR